MVLSTPDAFFSRLEADSKKLCRWTGELFLELHNGTYTTHAQTKAFNRQSELALREAELVCSVVATLSAKGGLVYPSESLEACWKDVLLNQFHDVLPGSCIAEARQDAEQIYEKVLKRVHQITDEALEKLFGECNWHLAETFLFLFSCTPLLLRVTHLVPFHLTSLVARKDEVTFVGKH